jgi:hypothetical protein
MADPILGKDVIVQFYKGGNFYNYACAENVEIQFSMDTKSVKTVGDGVWKRSKGQSLSYQVELTGLILDDSIMPEAFDLLNYYKNMTDVNYRLLFYDNAGLKKTITGYALPINVNLGGGSEGFASGNITLSGNGGPDQLITPSNPNPTPNPPTQPLPNCDAEIATAHVQTEGSIIIRRRFVVDSMVPGGATISRWDYTIDGGGIQTAFTSGSIPTNWLLPISAGIGTHTIIVTPICDNGFGGTPFTLTFP